MKAALVLLSWALAGPAVAADLQRGAYLVNGLGHCGACHTPRGLWAEEREAAALQGGSVQGWVAPPLTAPALQRWSEAELVGYLSSGSAPGHAEAAGPMREVVERSTRYLAHADLQAIAAYLKQLPGPAVAAPLQPAWQWQPARGAAGQAGGANAVFDRWCASCHAHGGAGLPALDAPALLARRAGPNLLPLMLEGIEHDGEVHMPAFAHLSDAQLAELATALGTRTYSPTDVNRARRGTHTPWQWAGWAALAGCLALIAWRSVRPTVRPPLNTN